MLLLEAQVILSSDFFLLIPELVTESQQQSIFSCSSAIDNSTTKTVMAALKALLRAREHKTSAHEKLSSHQNQRENLKMEVEVDLKVPSVLALNVRTMAALCTSVGGLGGVPLPDERQQRRSSGKLHRRSNHWTRASRGSSPDRAPLSSVLQLWPGRDARQSPLFAVCFKATPTAARGHSMAHCPTHW